MTVTQLPTQLQTARERLTAAIERIREVHARGDLHGLVMIRFDKDGNNYLYVTSDITLQEHAFANQLLAAELMRLMLK